MTPTTAGDILDAVALLRAYLAHDEQAQLVLCENGKQPAMLSALVCITAGMFARTPADEMVTNDYLENFAAHLIERMSE